MKRSDRCHSLAERLTIPYAILQYLFCLPWCLGMTGALDDVATRWQSLHCLGPWITVWSRAPCSPTWVTHMVCHLHLASSLATLTLSSVLEDATPFLDLKTSCMFSPGNPSFLCLNCYSPLSGLTVTTFPSYPNWNTTSSGNISWLTQAMWKPPLLYAYVASCISPSNHSANL